MDKRVIYTLLLIFSINLSFAQQYFVLEKNTDEYQTKNYELNTKNLYGIDKKIYLYNLLFEDLMHKSSPEKTLVLFSVLPSAENNNDWEEIGLDSIQNKIISVGTLRRLSDQSLYKRTDLKYGSTTKYWNNYKIIVENSGKYYSPKNCLLQFYAIQNRIDVFNHPYNSIDLSQDFHSMAEVKKLYTTTTQNNSFPVDLPPNDKYFDTLRERREYLSKKILIDQQAYYQFWTFSDWGRVSSKVTKDPHKVYFAYERGIDRFLYSPSSLIVGGSYDFYFYHYQNEFGINADVFQKNITDEKIMIAL